MNLQRLDNPQQLSPVAPLEPSQVDSLATVLSRTYQDEPELAYMVPDEEVRRIVSPSLSQSAIRAGQRYGEIHTTENEDGVAVWSRPEHDMPFHRIVRSVPKQVSFHHGLLFTAR